MAAGGLVYTAAWNNVSMTNAVQNIFEMIAAAGVSILVHSIRFTVSPTIVSGVAQDVRMALSICTLSSTGTGGSSVTPVAVNRRNTVAAVTTVNRMVTTPGAISSTQGGDLVSLIVPYERVYTPDQRLPVSGGGRLALNISVAAGAAYNTSGEIYFEEI